LLIWTAFLPTLLDPLPDPPNFYASQAYPGEYQSELRAISNAEHFFARLPVIPDAIEGWQRIIDEGFQPQICSSPIKSNPYSKREKLGWLEEHLAPVFGSWVVETAIITSDKFHHNGAALIDDRPTLPHADIARWYHVLFDRPCNRYVETDLRLMNWSDPNLGSILRRTVQLAD
jgi:5'(3')-deoxyribonucleotidase